MESIMGHFWEQQSAGLIGDHRITKGRNMTPPSMWVTDGSQGNQWKNFAKEMIHAQSIDGVNIDYLRVASSTALYVNGSF